MPALQAGHPGAIPGKSTSSLTNSVPWSSGNDSWFTPRQRWFESIRDHFPRCYFRQAWIRQSAERLGLNPSVCEFESHSRYFTKRQIPSGTLEKIIGLCSPQRSVKPPSRNMWGGWREVRLLHNPFQKTPNGPWDRPGFLKRVGKAFYGVSSVPVRRNATKRVRDRLRFLNTNHITEK